MKIHGGEIHSAEADGRQDHRIAMSLAVSALRSDKAVNIRGAECVEKSYPDFFRDLEHLRVK
jgi:3-phosphoshikimate 1-carboxyvinyltransferase